MRKCCTVTLAHIEDMQMKGSDSKKLKQKAPVVVAF
jgi:hypothetical protein